MDEVYGIYIFAFSLTPFSFKITGMSRGEIFNLKWSNIDFEYEFAELLETKSGKSRRIPISHKFMNILNQLDHTTEYVFTNPNTNKPYNDIINSFHSVLKKAEIYDFRFHDLRCMRKFSR